MATSALIVLDDESLGLRVFGLEWLEYTLRSIAAADITHVVVVVDRVPRTLGEIVDRVRRDGLRCTLARSATELGDLFHPDETVLVVGGSVLASVDLLADLAKATDEALVCQCDADGRSFERIDVDTWWTGLATVGGARLQAVADTPGEWNAASTLLRVAVQAGVARRVVAPTALFDAQLPVEVAAFQAHAIGRERPRAGGWGSRFVIDPVADLVVRRAASHLAKSAWLGPASAIVLASVALLVAVATFERSGVVCAGLVLLASVAVASARLSAGATKSSLNLVTRLKSLVAAGAAATAIVLAWPRTNLAVALVAALAAVGLTWLCNRGVRDLLTTPRWWPDLTGQTLFIAVAAAVVPEAIGIGFAVAAVHAFVALAWLQDRVSEVLRPHR